MISSASDGRTGRRIAPASAGIAAYGRVDCGIYHEPTKPPARTAEEVTSVGLVLRERSNSMSPAHRISNLIGAIVPFLAFIVAIPLLWNTWIGWHDVAVFALMYVVAGLGVTIGYHRL